MSRSLHTDIAVIGAGSGGLSVAAGASQMGARVVLVEKDKMGGDCLNTGCVPSKSLLAAAHVAQSVRDGGRFGVNGHEPEIDFSRVHAHVHDVIASIAPHDSVERFEGLGVQVVPGVARFTDPSTVQVGDLKIRARRFVVATGSSPAIPPIPGIESVPVHTNESIFQLTERPEHLVVIGAGPIGVEMAQAHRRLGGRVTLIEMRTLLGQDDPQAVDVVRRHLAMEGVDIREKTGVRRIAQHGNRIAIELEGGEASVVSGSHLLVAAGRKPNIEGLGLEAAGIAFTPTGIEVDARLRSSNKRVFAIGDVAGAYQFTHMASYHAGVVIRNALFRLPSKVDYRAVPWVTYSDPELAQVGLTENEAKARSTPKLRVLQWSFADNDRGRAERETDGFIKVITGAKGKVLGATIVGAHAGELLMPWILAVDQGLRIGAMAKLIAPYPTLGEVSKRVSGSYYTGSLFGPTTRKVVRFLQRLG